MLLDFASSFSMSELDKEIGQLRASLREAQSELEYQKKRTDRDPQDYFVVVMDDFMKSMGDSFSQLEGTVLEMKERVGGRWGLLVGDGGCWSGCVCRGGGGPFGVITVGYK